MKHDYIQVNNINIHYVEEGQGQLVILLHGWPDFWYGWKKQIPVLSKKYRVVAPDLRGFNLSDKPKHVNDYRIGAVTADIAELIKKLGSGKALIVGNDWGGIIAWVLATDFPELVDKVVFVNIVHPAEIRNALFSFNFSQWKKSYYIFAFQLPWIPEWIVGRNLKKFFKMIFTKLSPNAPDTVAGDFIAKYVEAYSRHGTLTSSINLYRAGMRNINDLRLHSSKPLSMPVLMLWGEKDITLSKELAERSKKYCSTVKTVSDPLGGHFLQLDNPELVNRELLDFFG